MARRGEEERLPLQQQGMETNRTAGPAAVAADGRKPRRLWAAAVRVALAVCFLAVPAFLLIQRWQAGASPEWLFDFEAPVDVDDDRGACASSIFLSYPIRVLAASILPPWELTTVVCARKQYSQPLEPPAIGYAHSSRI
jgi:hypothetical protein